MGKGRIYEGAKRVKHKRLVFFTHEIGKKDDTKHTLFNSKHPLWACDSYCNDEPSACSLTMFHKCRSDRMKMMLKVGILEEVVKRVHGIF